MSIHQPFTIVDVSVLTGRGLVRDVDVEVRDGVVSAIVSTARDEASRAHDRHTRTLLPGLIDSHVHLLPACTQMAALFGVTTVLDMFSKPDSSRPNTHGRPGRLLLTSSHPASGQPPQAATQPWPTRRFPT